MNDINVEKVLASQGFIIAPVKGDSMLPMLDEKKDSVRIVPVEGMLKKYDLPLYRLQNGSFVLHRVVKVLPDSYVMRGDCVVAKEYGITDSMIVGVVTGFSRLGKQHSVTSPFYRFYCRVWTAFPLLRRFVIHFGRPS